MAEGYINSVCLAEGRTGTPLVMLHGWNRNLDDLFPLAELLSVDRPVYVLDLPGFGSSDLPDGDWDTMQYAQRVVQFLDDKKIAVASLLGHSFGGRIALRIASHYPQRVSGLVLIGSHGLKRRRKLLDALRVRIVPKVGKLLKFLDQVVGTALYREKFVPLFASPDYQKSGALRGTLVKTVSEDQSQDAKKIKTPTLLIWGAKDSETPLEMGNRLHSYIDNSRLITLPHEGHDPFNDVNAHLCAFHINRFLGAAPARSLSNLSEAHV